MKKYKKIASLSILLLLLFSVFNLSTINHENHLFNVVDPGAANWVSKYYWLKIDIKERKWVNS